MAKKVKIDNATLKRFNRKETKRVKNTRIKKVYFLIVCEGEKTEPNYFEGLKKELPPNAVNIVNMHVEGTGFNTKSLIKRTISLKDSDYKDYDRVWAVFDRDSFRDNDFNDAISEAKQNNIECAWTNEAFELWYLLYFDYHESALSRDAYKGKIEAGFKRKGLSEYSYKKNDINMYKLLKEYGNIDDAIRNAKQLKEKYLDECYSRHNPCTMVHLLVNELLHPEEVLEKLEKEKEMER